MHRKSEYRLRKKVHSINESESPDSDSVNPDFIPFHLRHDVGNEC